MDSIIYTAFRILISSACFAVMHNLNSDLLPNSYVERQINYGFIIGIAFGILKETHGTSSSIGAHTIQDLTASLPEIVGKC